MRLPSIKPALRIAWLPGLLLAGMILASLYRVQPIKDIDRQRLTEGENLFHGLAIDQAASFTMPATSLWASLNRVHAPRPFSQKAPQLMYVVSVLLAFSLGRLLHSIPCGLLAALLCCLNPQLFGFDDERMLMGPALLAIAHIAAWRSLAIDSRRGAVLGLSIGSALLIKSSLSLYPVLLTGYELAFHRRRPWTKRLKLLLPVWAAILFMLAPWIGMNFAIHGRFIPFELNRSDESIVSGALGLTSVVGGGNIMKAVGIEEKEHILLWAAGEVLRHPVRYVSACVERARQAALLHPLFVIFGFLSFWLYRKREPHRQVALLAAYYFAIHCLVGTSNRYFDPLWPVLVVLAATTAFYKKKAPVVKKPSLTLVWACGAPVFALALFAMAVVAAYPLRRELSDRGLDEALSNNPRDPWLWTQRGRKYMKNRRFGPATRAFGSALKLEPDQNHRLDYQWARGMLGFPIVDELPFILPDDTPNRVRRDLILGVSALARKEKARADLVFSGLRRYYRKNCGPDWKTGEPEIQDFQKRACAAGELQTNTIYDILTPLNLDQYSFAIRRLGFMAEGDARRNSQQARSSLLAGNPAEALRHLERAAAASSAFADTTWSAKLQPDHADLYARLGRYPEARRIWKKRGDPVPAESEFWFRQAQLLRETKGRKASLQALARMSRLDPAPSLLKEAAGLYSQLKDHRGAADAMGRALGKRPKDIEALLEHAVYAEKAGKGEQALRSLGKIEKIGGGASQLISVARLYEKLGDSSGAARVYAALTLENPKAADLWIEHARHAAASGDKTTALASLARAEALHPPDDLLRNIVSHYLGLGEPRRADGVLRGLLSNSPDDPSLVLEKVRILRQTGGREKALRSLSDIRRNSPPRTLLLIAIEYQKLKAYAPAIEILNPLTKNNATAAQAFTDRGVCEFLLGNPVKAEADFRAALRVDAEFKPARISLKTLLTSLGRTP